MTDSNAGRAIGLDLGTRRIGVAICDDARTVATPYRTVRRVGDRKAEHGEIGEIAASEDATLIVVGLPLSLDGSEGPAARLIRSEIKALTKSIGLEVVVIDERLTTVTADRDLAVMGVKAAGRREMVDQLAATVILQSFLDTVAER